MTEDDERHLRRAIELAANARENGEQPFGSLLVGSDGEVLAEDHNRVNSTGDISHHPELKLAVWAARNLDAETASRTTMYTSCQPCGMCAGAIARSHLGRVVFALSGDQADELERAAPRTGPAYEGPALYDEARRPFE